MNTLLAVFEPLKFTDDNNGGNDDINGVDTESMYYTMILETGTALEACNFNVRA